MKQADTVAASENQLQEKMPWYGKPFKPIKEAAKLSGMSEYSLRLLSDQGVIPGVRCPGEGGKFLVNFPLLLGLNTQTGGVKNEQQ